MYIVSSPPPPSTSLVNAKCPNCGGTLEVDKNKDAWICTYCSSPFIVEKAINNYNITNNNHITANVVNVYEEIMQTL